MRLFDIINIVLVVVVNPNVYSLNNLLHYHYYEYNFYPHQSSSIAINHKKPHYNNTISYFRTPNP